MATIGELTKRINVATAKKDKTVAAYRIAQKILTADLDVLRAAEAAAGIVAELSEAERQAVLTELGGN